MKIYLDIYFLKNFIFDFLCILICGEILKVSMNLKRYILASLFGALYAVVTIITQNIFLQSVFCKILIAFFITLIAFKINQKNKIKMCITFLITTFTIGGVLTALNVGKLIYHQLVGFVISAGLLITFWKIYKTNILKNSMMCKLKIKIDDISFYSKAFIDTGNNLHDNVSGATVILVSKSKLEKELPKDLLLLLEEKIFEVPARYVGKVRMIEYQAINNSKGVLLGVKLDEVDIIYNNEVLKNSNVIMGLALDDFEEFECLIGMNLLEEGYVYGNITSIENESKKIMG